MSLRLSHRPAISALVLAALFLALAASPAQAAQGSSLLDHLGSKVQTWLASWLPGVRVDGAGVTEPKGGAALGGRAQQAGKGNHHQGRAFHPVIRPLCETSPSGDPNGCPSH
jgi:hypothetical protein